MKDLGQLILRLTTGGLLAGHGSQKLFGWFSGYGLQGTAGFYETLGLKPGKPWTIGSGLSEFGGGTLTALGLLYPLGPMGLMAAMSVAIAKVHWGKPIWASEGGAELPLTDLAVALALALEGPGRYSLDHLFGIRLPRTLVAAAAIAEAALVTLAIVSRPTPQPPATENQAGAELQSDQTAETR
jgi:putative oxidoreductase